MNDRTYPEARESVFVGGPLNNAAPRRDPFASFADALAAMPRASEAVSRERLFRDLCTLLHLDPERATVDDVLRLVGECVDRATEAERLAEQRETEASRIFCAWLRDRAARWVPSSGIFAAINDELATASRDGEPFEAYRAAPRDRAPPGPAPSIR